MTPMQRFEQQKILFQPEETAPSLPPEIKAKSIELLSLMLLEIIRNKMITNKEESNERKDSADTLGA